MREVRAAAHGGQRAAVPGLLLGVLLLVLVLNFSMPDRGTMRIALSRTAERLKDGSASSGTASSTHQRLAWASFLRARCLWHSLARQATSECWADPKLPEKDADLRLEFEAAPWLLPPRTKALPYAGVHDLHKLAALRSTREGGIRKAVTLLTFNPKFAVMAQNAIYSMVKFGGVRNYIVGTWEQADLEACADLNLPCADVSAYLPEPLDHVSDGVYDTHDYYVITWLSSFIVKDLLKKGYAVHYSDADVVYTIKQAWASYLAFVEEAQADAAFQVELGFSAGNDQAVNTGNYVVLPTPGSIAMFEGWTAGVHEAIAGKANDQQHLEVVHDRTLRRCTGRSGCIKAREEMQANNQTGQLALIHAYHHGYFMYSNDHCELANAGTAPLFDTCDWTILYFHPICTDYDGKRAAFVKQQMWFVDEARCLPRKGSASKVKACEPVRWVQQDYEQHLYSCPQYSLALSHSRPAPLLAGGT